MLPRFFKPIGGRLGLRFRLIDDDVVDVDVDVDVDVESRFGCQIIWSFGSINHRKKM